MSDNNLVTAWKNPAARHLAAGPHPAGEIRISTVAVVGRRAQLLAGVAAAADATTPLLFPTYTASWTYPGH